MEPDGWATAVHIFVEKLKNNSRKVKSGFDGEHGGIVKPGRFYPKRCRVLIGWRYGLTVIC